jgi:hypothetical protein
MSPRKRPALRVVTNDAPIAPTALWADRHCNVPRLLVYHPGMSCRLCGGKAWNVGRVMAECATDDCGGAAFVRGQG